MEPGESRTIEVELPASGFAFGRRSAVVEVQGLDETSAARTGVTTYPWALIAIVAVAGQFALLRVRNRIRRRLAPPPGELEGPAPPRAPDEPAAEAAAPVPALVSGGGADDADDDGEVIDLRDVVDVRPARVEGPDTEPQVEDAMVVALDDWDRRAALASAALRSVLERVEGLERADAEVERLRAELASLSDQIQRLANDQLEIRESLPLLAARAVPRPVDELDERIASACLAALRSDGRERRAPLNGHRSGPVVPP
jgi:hypothetical protein